MMTWSLQFEFIIVAMMTASFIPVVQPTKQPHVVVIVADDLVCTCNTVSTVKLRYCTVIPRTDLQTCIVLT